MLLKLFDSGMKPNPTLLLTVAMLYSNPQMGRFLLENGASASDRDIVSALQPNKNIPASIFYKQNFAVPFNAPESPVCFAIGAAPHLLPLLLEKGANPDGKNLMGRSALILAVMKNDLKSVKILLEHNANIENDDGFLSPLALAVKLDKEPIVRFLLSRGANPNGKGNPLQMAKLKGNKEMISLLTQAGAH